MIKLLDRYIARTIFSATLLVVLVFGVLVFVMTLLAELKSVGNGDYTILKAFAYTLLHLPNDLYQFSPLLLLLGCMIGLGILSAGRELSVMRTSGFTLWQIIKSVFLAALVIVFVMSTLGELIAPHLSYLAEVHKENAENAGMAVVTQSGVWFHIDNNFIHVQRVMGHNRLEGVTRYQFNANRELEAAYHADTLTFSDNNWWMNNVVSTVFTPQHTKSDSVKQLKWDLSFNTNLLNVGLVEPKQMTLPRLYQFMRYLQVNGLQSHQYQYDFWQRLFQPFAALVMIFLAIPFVLGGFAHVHPGVRVFVGLLIGFAFFIFDALLAQLSVVYQIPALLAAFVPLLIFSLIAFFLARRLLR